MNTNKVIDKNMAVLKADTEGIKFFSPDAEEMSLGGFAWRAAGMPYDRLAGYDVTPEFGENIVSLAKFPAGGYLRFVCDTGRIVIRAAFRRAHKIVRMALTGTMGFDIYVREEGEMVFRGVTAFDFDAMEYCVDLFRNETRRIREFMIHFPLYAEPESIEIGFDNDTVFQSPPQWQDARPLVCYGTSILHGACANRPGMAYPAILSRLLDRPVLNFGFAGSARGEQYMARMLSQVENPCGFILDYDPNSGWENTRATLADFVAILRAEHAEVPIVFVSKIPYPADFPKENQQKQTTAQGRAELESELVSTINDKNLQFICGLDLMDKDYCETSVDGCHISDYGFAQIAKNLSGVLGRVL